TLSMNGFSAVNSVPIPFVLSPSKDSEWFFNSLLMVEPVQYPLRPRASVFVSNMSHQPLRCPKVESQFRVALRVRYFLAGTFIVIRMCLCWDTLRCRPFYFRYWFSV